MKLTQNNGEQFTEWEQNRPVKSRLRSILKQLNTINCHYEETGLPSQWAISNEFSYRVHLLFWDNSEKKFIAETAHKMCSRGDTARYKKLYPDWREGERYVQVFFDEFEEAMRDLKKYLIEELEALDAQEVKKNV